MPPAVAYTHMSIREYVDEFTRRDWQAADADDGSVRFAMVGLGWWTREQAIPATEESELCETTVVVSGKREKAQRVAQDVGAEAGLTYEAFADGRASDAYDAVYVCTPNATHLEHVEAAADLGKDVLCEKPMEATVERGRKLVAACEDAGVTLMVAYRMHTEPAVRRARDLVRDGAIGEPALVHGNMSERILELVPDPDQWRLDPDLAGYGTSVMDIGLYPLNTARFVLDADPVAVTAQTSSDAEHFEDVPDERAAFTVRYEGNVQAAMPASQNAALASHLRITGTEGEIRIEPAFYPWQDRELHLDVEGERADVRFEQIDQMVEEFDYFADRLLTSRRPLADGAHGLLDLRTLGAIYEAGDRGEAVEIGP